MKLLSRPILGEGIFLSILACLNFKELVVMLTSCSVAVPDIYTPPTAITGFLALYIPEPHLLQRLSQISSLSIRATHLKAQHWVHLCKHMVSDM